MTARAEQETTVSAGRDDDMVHIYTSNVVHLRRLRKDARFTEVRGDEEQGFFMIPADLFDPIRGLRRKRAPMTDEQRAEASARLAAAREAR
jgi:hypothetical protein